MLITEENRKWWVGGSVALALAMIFIDQTAVAVILPHLHRDLGLSEIGQQWVINSYLLVLTVLAAIGGRVSDIWGHKRVFLIGMVGFILGSILCAIALHPWSLMLGRVVQGVFGALLTANTAVQIINIFPYRERGMAMGLYAGAATIFLTVGPLIGGFFTQYLSWRWVFLVNVPFGLLSFFLALHTIPKDIHKAESRAIDWRGFFVLAIATTSFIFALMEGKAFGWGSLLIVSLFVIAVIGFVMFFIIENRVPVPLINLRILREGNYLICTILRMLMQVMVMARVFWVLFFQLALGAAPLLAGLMLIPSTLPNLLIAPIGGKLLDRFGARLPAITGFIFTTVGLFWIVIFCGTLNYWGMFVGIMLTGIGLPLIGPPLITVALSEVDVKERGAASGFYNQARQMGATTGIALVGAIIANVDAAVFKSSLKSAQVTLTKIPPVDTFLAGSKVEYAHTLQVSASVLDKVHHLAQMSYMVAFRYGMLATGIISLMGLVLAIYKIKK